MKKARTRQEWIAETREADAAEAYAKIGSPIERVVRYRCTCGEEYLSIEEAASCLATECGPSFAVGDVVTAGSERFGWFNGDERWIASRKPGRSATGEIFGFFYVVTHVDRDDSGHTPGAKHRPRYHLATGAMTGGYRTGYTFDVHHVRPTKVENPPELPGLEELIGTVAKSLL